jgi:hypothetical protein
MIQKGLRVLRESDFTLTVGNLAQRVAGFVADPRANVSAAIGIRLALPMQERILRDFIWER